MSVMVRRSRQLYSDPVTDYMTGYVDHLILGAASFQTDYQVLIRVYRGYGQNSGNAVYIPSSECRPDFSDVRFADTAGRLLPYWMESSGAIYADFWVRLYQIPTTGAVVRVMFGGGGALASVSNGATTFPTMFDDFTGSALSPYWGTNANATVSNGVLALTSASGAWGTVISSASVASPCQIVTRAKSSLNSGTVLPFGVAVDMSVNNATVGYGCNGYRLACSNTSGFGTYINKYSGSWSELDADAYAVATDTYYILQASLYSSGTTIDLSLYSDARGAKLQSSQATDTAYTSGYIGLLAFQTAASPTITATYDWVLVKKYVSPEPSHGWWGSLEDL